MLYFNFKSFSTTVYTSEHLVKEMHFLRGNSTQAHAEAMRNYQSPG